MTFIDETDVIARLSTQAYQRLFAKSGGGLVDTAFRDLCVAEANSRASMILFAAFPSDIDTTPDEGLKGCVVDMALGVAAMRHPSSDPVMGSYAKLKAEAEKFLQQLNRDKDARPVTAASGRAKPRASIANEQTEAGEYTNVFSRAADQKDGTGY